MGNLHSSLLKELGNPAGVFHTEMPLSLGELRFKPSGNTAMEMGWVGSSNPSTLELWEAKPLGHYFQME